jgi:hypothetical protein
VYRNRDRDIEHESIATNTLNIVNKYPFDAKFIAILKVKKPVYRPV